MDQRIRSDYFGGHVLGSGGSDFCMWNAPFRSTCDGDTEMNRVNCHAIRIKKFHTPNSSVRKNKLSPCTTWIPEVVLRILSIFTSRLGRHVRIPNCMAWTPDMVAITRRTVIRTALYPTYNLNTCASLPETVVQEYSHNHFHSGTFRINFLLRHFQSSWMISQLVAPPPLFSD